MKYTYYVCPECGSDYVWFFGYQDGVGDYGNGVEETWECGNCGCMADIDYFDVKEGDDGRTESIQTSTNNSRLA